MTWISGTQAQAENWDLIIVGSGIGGSSAAFFAALKNKRVLVITKRVSVPWSIPIHDVVSGRELIPFLGDGLGGSSVWYGMVMERLHAADFRAGGGAWPGSLEGWQTAYRAAEDAFEVRPAPDFAELAPLQSRFTSRGLAVKKLPLACRQVDGCSWCQSRACEKNCKVSAVNGPLQRALETGSAFLLDGQVSRLRPAATSNDESHEWVEVFEAATAQKMILRASNVVLAAGALVTPGLLAPAFPNLPAVGHYLMRHLIDCYVLKGLRFSAARRAEVARAKAWGTDAFCGLGSDKLGTLQSFGQFPAFEIIWKEMRVRHPWLKTIPFSKWGARLVIGALTARPVMAAIVEDEPHIANYIARREDGGLDMHYRLSARDQEKIKTMRRKTIEAMGGYFLRLLPEAENNFRLAHACGTCRMGHDPVNSVVDDHGRVHGSRAIWISDASVFPSSGGHNPALTIAAHAFRVIEQIDSLTCAANAAPIP